MTRLNRYTPKGSIDQSQFNRRWTSKFRSQTGVVIAVLDRGYLPQGHNDLPKPFASFKVETNEGKRYIVRIEGRQATELHVELGYTLYYEGVFKGRYVDNKGQYHGEYWSATFVEVDETKMDPYVAGLIEAKFQMDRDAAEK